MKPLYFLMNDNTHLGNRLRIYLTLARFDKPVGIFLLLWPTLWALWVAASGSPNPIVLGIFGAGVVLMRAAGCVINDFADRHWDGHIARTQNRPLATGAIRPQEALFLFLGLCLPAFGLVLMTNLKTVLLSVIALGIAILYPFTKRITHWPQAFLGVAFAFSVPMSFSAQNVPLNLHTLLLFLATLAWTIAYDTEYAMVDRTDDLKIGIKSTAVLFGRYDRLMIGCFQGATLGLLVLLGACLDFGVGYYFGLAGALLLFVYQQKLVCNRDPKNCLRAFLNNQWVGASIFAGLAFNFT